MSRPLRTGSVHRLVPRRRPALVIWFVLSVALVAAVFSTEFLPFYDYYEWLFQGHVTSVLLFGTGDAARVASEYVLSPVPVPNLAAPIGIALLDTFLPVETAGRVFVAVTALGFALAYGFLVRTLQRRPTAVEYTGFLWALGFFAYKGYLSYLFGLGLAFVLIALLHRTLMRGSGPGAGRLVLLALLGTLAYLSHLMAWSICVVAVVLYALLLRRRGRGRAARGLLATLVPAAVMTVWYVLAEHGGTGITLYTSWFDKAISLTETVQFFLRLDPFPPLFPIFWVNLLIGLAVLALFLGGIDRSRLRTAFARRPVLWLAALLAGIAVVLPISMVNDLIKPDERYVLPALLLAAAALPYRRRAVHRRPGLAPTAAVVTLVLVVLGLHAAEYVDVGGRIAATDAATDAAVPFGSRMLSLSIASRYGCTPQPGISVGVPVLKWFGVDQQLDGGQGSVNVDETSLVHAKNPEHPAVNVLTPTVDEVSATVAPFASVYPYVQVVACPGDLAAVQRDLAPTYRPVAEGQGYLILHRRD